jgi:peptidoglycan-associated lipoprotein
MRKRLWISVALLLIIPGLLFTTSCAKKKIKSDTAIEQETDGDAAKSAAEKAKEEELARQRELEEQRLKEKEEAEKREIAESIAKFENEDIYFEFDSAALLPMAQEILKKKAAYLETNPGVSVVVGGHCDERGTSEYNLALGDRRARSAASFLVDLGISASRLTAISYGEERLIDSGSNEEAWAKNRRAHFVIK